MNEKTNRNKNLYKYKISHPSITNGGLARMFKVYNSQGRLVSPQCIGQILKREASRK